MDVEASFENGLLSEASQKSVREAYVTSEPYRHAVIDRLMDDDLLRRARQEIIDELRFTEKETDIYKVNQTGDLANLDGLPKEEAGRLGSVLEVRNALYSSQFRAWLESVTRCGPLSAKKKDMSINDYTSGCHLLNHDDVISTRRVSYILYLTDPSEPWDRSNGGALELYPVKDKHVPANIPSLIIPPKWNQFTFFAVQPGHSFHAVEEVVHPTKSRLSISGWFHRPQTDEPGFDAADESKEEEARKEHASAESLLSKGFDLPFAPLDSQSEAHLPGSSLSVEEKRFLSRFLNPAYLQDKTQEILFEKFGDESHLLLVDVLSKDLAGLLDRDLQRLDSDDGFRWWERGGRSKLAPSSHNIATNSSWTISGPPHRQRYLTFSRPSAQNDRVQGGWEHPKDAEGALQMIRDVLLPSSAFRNFLSNVTQLVPMSARATQVRRFRPGLDYTLARSDAEAVLDVTFDLTPDASAAAMKASGATGSAPKGLAAKKRTATLTGSKSASITRHSAKKLKECWENGEVGGWEAYMPPADDDDDPAVYGSGVAAANGVVSTDEDEYDSKKSGVGGEEEGEEDEVLEMEMDTGEGEEADEDEDEDGVLLNLTPTFNTLSLVLRDEGVMKFVKYLSASAGGSRFDIQTEYLVGAAVTEDAELAA